MLYEASVPIRAALLRVAFDDPAGPLSIVASRIPGPHVAPMLNSNPERAETSQQLKEDREMVGRLLANLKSLGQELHGQQRQRLTEMQQVAVQLAVAIASRLVHAKIETGDFAVENLVRELVEKLEPKHAVSVRLHPRDLALLEERTGSQLLVSSSGAEIELVADDSLARGDCRAETGDVSILSRLEDQLAGIRKLLEEKLVDAEVERRTGTPEAKTLRFTERRHTA